MGLFSKKDKSPTAKFEAFIDSCYQELIKKQKQLIKQYQLSAYDRFWIDQKTEILQFISDDEVKLEFYYLPVGSWSANSNSWMWAWANTSLTEELRAKATVFRELAELTNNSIFTTPSFEAEEITAHELTAMAVHHIDAPGMYIAPSGHLKTFVALLGVK